jgi:hypothetical protein
MDSTYSDGAGDGGASDGEEAGGNVPLFSGSSASLQPTSAIIMAKAINNTPNLFFIFLTPFNQTIGFVAEPVYWTLYITIGSLQCKKQHQIGEHVDFHRRSFLFMYVLYSAHRPYG